MLGGLRRLVIAAAVVAGLVTLPAAARAYGIVPSNLQIVDSTQPSGADLLTPDPDAARRTKNRWYLSVSIGVLAGALVGTAVATSAPLVAAVASSAPLVTGAPAVLYATQAAVIAATAALGGYLGGWFADY